jgi:D-sedoheptulose 7-phosphate isomerase
MLVYEKPDNILSRKGQAMDYARQHLAEAGRILDQLDVAAIERMASLLAALRDQSGRLFFLGVGGSAANCSHAVNDFRKLVGLEAYAPTDNVSELTARTNDEGGQVYLSRWLKIATCDRRYVVCSFGWRRQSGKNISPNLVQSMQYAKDMGAKIVGIMAAMASYTAQVARCLCDRTNGQSQNRDAAFRSVPSNCLAPVSVPSYGKSSARQIESE